MWGRDPWSLGTGTVQRAPTRVLVTFEHLTKTLVMTGASTLLMYIGDISWTFNAASDIHFHLISPGKKAGECSPLQFALVSSLHPVSAHMQLASASRWRCAHSCLYFLGADEVLSSDLDPRFVD